jgi:uncharacterized repeat protein (TIGR01451 family)
MLIAFGLLLLGSVRPTATVQAEGLLQGVPLLNGYKIYFTEANGEAVRFNREANGISRLAGLLRLLGAELFTLDWRASFPTDADLVIVAGSTSDFSADQTARLWTYLDADGSLLLLSDPITGTTRSPQGLRAESGIFTLMWDDAGMRVRDDIVVTENTSGGGAPLVEDFLSANYNDAHPIAAGAGGELYFSTVRSVAIDSSLQSFIVTPLVFSPDDYYGEISFFEYRETDLAEYNIGEDTTRGAQAVVVTAENSAANVRVALIGDRDFILNGGGLRTSPATSAAFVYPENARFMMRLIAWLLQADPANTYEFTFDTPGPTATVTITPTPIVTNADLVVTMTPSTTEPQEGEAVVYEITLTNSGPEIATAVTLTAALPEQVRFVSATASTRRGYNNTTGVWDVGDLAVDATATLTLVVQINPETVGMTIPLTAAVNPSDAIRDSDTSNNQSTVEVIVAAGS